MRRALIVVLALAGTGTAAADDLAWTAPPACPTLADVRARIEHRLGAPMGGVVHDVIVDVVRAKGGAFVATIDLRGVTLANDIRTLTAARCDELADAVAVIVARVASEARARPAEPVVVDPPVAPTPVRSSPTPIRVVDAPAPPMPRWGGGMHLLGVSGIGGVPDVGLGGELAAYVRRDALYGELSAAHWTAGSAYIHEGAPARVDIGLDVVALRLGWGAAQLPIRAWVTGETGTMGGEGVDLANPQVGSSRWTAAGAGFGVAWPMTRWARVIGSVEFVVPFQRVHFVLEGGIEVYRSWPMSSRAALGLEVGWR
ncbi:MAG: hypothetical protein NT062_33205 [Proteobacteria bacterium]|nr:hypothetical protein [Pseudomonadota bacterium]